MFTYNIKDSQGYTIGTARGRSNAFKYIQKEIYRTGNLGYWSEDKYVSNEGINYSIERSGDE